MVERDQWMIRRVKVEVKYSRKERGGEKPPEDGGEGQDQNGRRVHGLVGKREKIQKWLAIIRPIGWRRLAPDPSPLNTRLKLQRVIFTLKKKKNPVF